VRLTADLVAKAGKDYSSGDTDAALYHLLLAVVGAVDLDVNVTDALKDALAEETEIHWLPLRRRERSGVEQQWSDAVKRSDTESR
jgi:hypothetical protein